MNTNSRAAVPAGSLIEEGTAALEASGVSEAGLNCGWLLATVLGRDRLSMLADKGSLVAPGKARLFRRLLARKAAGEPLAYIIGTQPFCGLSLKVDRRVLVPRPETEELVALASDFLNGSCMSAASRHRILDFGTGSGAIALALAAAFPRVRVTAADRSRRALACARENADALGLAGRVEFAKAGRVKDCGRDFDMVVSNPPYVPTGVIAGLDREVRAEPRVALDGGADGTAVAASIIAQAPEALRSGGALFMEIGDSQASSVLGSLCPEAWKEGRVLKDSNGKRRFLRAVRR